MIWDCPGSKKVWDNLRIVFQLIGIGVVIDYGGIIFGRSNDCHATSLIITKIAQILTRKNRPKNLSVDNIRREINELHKIELYIAKKILNLKYIIKNGIDL